MRDTVSLFEELASRGRRLQQADQATSAAACLERLLSLAGVPGPLAAEAHQRLGEIALKRRAYRRARRHLQAAVRLAPGRARGHFLLGLAWAQDEGDPHRAARHFRQALKQAPHLTRCRGELGLITVRLGDAEGGLTQLRQAVEQAPVDAAALGRLVKGLMQCDRFDEARAVLREARFRAPRCWRLRKLEVDLQLAALRRECETRAAQREQGPVVLPFLRAYEAPAEGAVLHPAHAPARPHLVRLKKAVGPRDGRK